MPEPDRDLQRLRRDWEALGAADPLWAVYVADERSGGRWQVDAFLRTGQCEVEESWRQHDRILGFVPPEDGVALDFGCGVGRLSSALADRMGRVAGIDISEPMLRTARDVIPSSAAPRVSLILSSSPRIPLADGSVDLVYSSLVLQHMPEVLARGYLREFSRVLRPGGTAIIQVAEEPDLSVKGWAFRLLPHWLYGVLQRRVLRYPAPMRMQGLSMQAVATALAGCGAQVVASWEDTTYGGHWRYRRILIRRDGAPEQP